MIITNWYQNWPSKNVLTMLFLLGFSDLHMDAVDASEVETHNSNTEVREDLLRRLSDMLHQNNELVKSSTSLRDLIESNKVPEDVKLVMHAHERRQPGHTRKYNLPESSEFAAMVVGEQYGKMDIVLTHRGQIDKNGNEKLDFIHLGHRMYDPLAYPLIFPYGSDGWHSKLRYLDSKDRFQKVSPLKFYCRLLYQRNCDFNTLIHSGRLFQQFLCEIFVKVESETLSFLRQNQSKLRASDYTHLCEILADGAMNTNEV